MSNSTLKSGPPSRNEGKRRLKEMSEEVGLDDQSLESASAQILSWKDDESEMDAALATPLPQQDPSPFSPTVSPPGAGAIKKQSTSSYQQAYSTQASTPLERSSSEASCISPLQAAASQFLSAASVKNALASMSSLDVNPGSSTRRPLDDGWIDIVDKMPILDLFNNYFADQRNVRLQRETNQFIHQYEVVACFSLMNYMKEGLISRNYTVSDAQLGAFMSGFNIGTTHANQTSLEKSIVSLDALIKQSQNFLTEQRDAMETLHQNTDVLQKNVQRSIGEMNKLRDLPDQLSDIMETARSKYETPRFVRPQASTATLVGPNRPNPLTPCEDEYVVITIHGIKVKVCKEALGQDRSIRMGTSYRNYFAERPHIIKQLKEVPWNIIKACDGKDMSAHFKEH